MTVPIPVLLCPACGAMALPHLEKGTGPHVAKAVCRSCHRFIKWLPKAKEPRMHASINRVVLLGIISTYGMEVRYNNTGTPCTSFTLNWLRVLQLLLSHCII
jgi:hypothetical protein